jgi:peptidoglycan-associated lipoprotein
MKHRKAVSLLVLALFLGVTPVVMAKSLFLESLPQYCRYVIELTRTNVQIIDSLNQASRRPMLMRIDSACLPSDLNTQQVYILRQWVKRGNFLWITFNPLRRATRGNTDWAVLFDVKAISHDDSELLTRAGGTIHQHPITAGVRYIHIGSPQVTPSVYYFQGEKLIPILSLPSGPPVLAVMPYGRGRIIFDGFAWLWWEVQPGTLERPKYDYIRLWENFLRWACACQGPCWIYGPTGYRTARRGPQKYGRFSGLLSGDKDRDTRRFWGESVYFDLDKSHIRPEAETVLNFKVAYMMAYPDVRVRLEGNCDDRAGYAYNMALGNRRAAAVKAYLVRYGISPTRFRTISYGKTRPVCRSRDENCRQQNRRVQFRPL